MASPNIFIAHSEQQVSSEARLRLEAHGYVVREPVSSATELAVSHPAVILLEAELSGELLPFDAPLILIATEEYAGWTGGAKCPDGIVSAPFRGRELENAVDLVVRRITCDRNRAIVEALQHYALFFLERDGTIASWNPGAALIYGYEPAEILGQKLAILYPEDDRNSGVPETELRLAGKEGFADDTRWLLRRNGERFWTEGLTTAIRNTGGEVTGYAKITRDATERRRLERQLERSNDELQRFAYTVSHDLQEPLRTVRSYAELLQRRYKGRLDTDADEFIEFMMDAAGRMTQLLKDLLAYSQAGRPDRTSLEPTQVANILQWAIMNVDKLVKETGATITHDPMPMVEADQTQLSQVFQNLLANAIKYRSQDPPRIHLSAERSGNLYEFSIKDNGIGVPAEHHDRIFGVFKRLHGKEVPGTGIGLAICRKIIESHGGNIWIESETGRGSTFKFTLPAHDP